MKPASLYHPPSDGVVLLLALWASGWAVPAQAGARVAGEQVYGLTDQQKAEVASTLRAAPTDASAGQLPGGASDRQVHGEIAAIVGTGGARGVTGTAAIPLGQNGGAIISFENSRFGDRRYGWR